MGEHKYNPTAIAAKKGELPPKKKKMSKRESERELRQLVCVEVFKRLGFAAFSSTPPKTNDKKENYDES